MSLADFETDCDRVLDELVDGRVDIPWLSAQVERLTAIRDQLPESDRHSADFTLNQLRDFLQADRSDAAGKDAPRRAVQIRAATEQAILRLTEPAEQLARLEQGLRRLGTLAESVTDRTDVPAISAEAHLLAMRMSAIRAISGIPARARQGDVAWSSAAPPDLWSEGESDR